MNPIIITFYTLRTPHEGAVKNLIESCEKHDIEADVVGVEPGGALKPSFILEKLRQWKRPILWVDADAVFRQRPDFSDLECCDVSARMNEFLPENHASRILSKTVFVQNNEAGTALLEQWSQEANKKRALEFSDQMALRDALNRNKEARFMPLPLKYAKTFDFDALFISEKEVVIEHFQVSRRYAIAIDHCRH